MYRHVVKSMVLVSLAALIGLPAAAQVRVHLGPVHIRIADDAPPRARYERRMARTSRDAVWINGYWHRDDDRWVWMSGRWEQRPDRRSRWIKARYKRDGNAWRYEPARWSNQQVVEGDDYQRWRDERRSDRNRWRN